MEKLETEAVKASLSHIHRPNRSCGSHDYGEISAKIFAIKAKWIQLIFLHNTERRPSFGLHSRGFLTVLIMMLRVFELSPRMLLFYVIVKEAAASGRWITHSFSLQTWLGTTLDSDVSLNTFIFSSKNSMLGLVSLLFLAWPILLVCKAATLQTREATNVLKLPITSKLYVHRYFFFSFGEKSFNQKRVFSVFSTIFALPCLTLTPNSSPVRRRLSLSRFLQFLPYLFKPWLLLLLQIF